MKNCFLYSTVFKVLIWFPILILPISSAFGIPSDVKSVQKAVVTIKVNDFDSSTKGAKGKGFFISKNLLVTNAHTVINFKKWELSPVIRMETGDQYNQSDKNMGTSPLYPEVVGLKALLPLHDLAILEIKDYDGATIPLSTSSKSVVGSEEEIYVVVPSSRRNYRILKGQNLKEEDSRLILTVDGTIVRGNSGSPALNAKGELVGILHQAVYGSNYASFIPVKYLREIVQTVNSGLSEKLINKEMAAQSLEEFEDLAKVSALAQYEFAIFLKDVEPERSEELFEKAANQGHTGAKIELGNIFRNRALLENNPELWALAKSWFESAGDHPLAKYNLGVLHCSYCNNLEVYKDDVVYFNYMLEVATENLAWAQIQVSDMYERGFGTTPNEQQELYWAERAAANGNMLAKHKIGMAYRYGRMGIQPNIRKAFTLFIEADQEIRSVPFIPSRRELGLIQLYGLGDIEVNVVEATKNLVSAFVYGDEPARTVLNAMYREVETFNKDSEGLVDKPHPSHIQLIELLKQIAEDNPEMAMILSSLQEENGEEDSSENLPQSQ